MFNIYYINYAKAYEIAMLLDNKILEQITKEHNAEGGITGVAETGTGGMTEIPLVGRYLPKLSLNGELTGSKSSKVIDTLGAKTFLSGAFGDIAVDGIGNVNLPTLLEVLFKDSAYILEGVLPEKRFGGTEKIVIKIPMQAENEMENQYSLSDLEIGKVTIIGIYRGCFKRKELNKKLSRFVKNQDETVEDVGIESDEENVVKKALDDNIHYIDVISIVQDISF